jgi:hypothetical protein
MSDAETLVRTICSLSCSTTARIVVGLRCRSRGAGLRGFHYNRSRGFRCRATHDRTGYTAHGGSNWPTYDGSSYGAASRAGKRAVAVGKGYGWQGCNGES